MDPCVKCNCSVQLYLGLEIIGLNFMCTINFLARHTNSKLMCPSDPTTDAAYCPIKFTSQYVFKYEYQNPLVTP